MWNSLKHKIIGAFIIYLFCGVTSVFACRCIATSTEDTIKNSSIVLSGKIIGFEYRKGIPNQFMDKQAKLTGNSVDYETLVVKVRVEQTWKSDTPREIFLLTSETRNADGTFSSSTCDFHFLKDKTYLIFASGKENEYQTSKCSGTQELDQAEKDLKILGEGKKPIEIINDPRLPL